jgi:hypothetical protein
MPLGSELDLAAASARWRRKRVCGRRRGAIEPLGWRATAVALLRRRFTSLRRSPLNFDGVEAPLRGLGFVADSFAPEAGRVDGALEHAVERLFNHATRVAGFRVEAVSVDDEGAAPTAQRLRTSTKS